MFYCLAGDCVVQVPNFVGHKIVEISGVVMCSTVWQGDCVEQVPNL